jgi:hypothetical protein
LALQYFKYGEIQVVEQNKESQSAKSDVVIQPGRYLLRGELLDVYKVTDGAAHYRYEEGTRAGHMGRNWWPLLEAV